jgi:PAS domain S-box-containing protein
MTNENALNQEFESTSKLHRYASFEGWMVVIFTILTALFLVYYFFDLGGKESLNLICDISQSSISIAAFLTALHISKSKLLDDETKKAWQKLSFAFFSFASGQFIWFYLNSIVGEPPFPSTADIGYIGFYPLMLWALRSFPTAPQTQIDKKKFWLDASTVMVSSFVVVYHFIIQPVIANGDEKLKIILNLIYVIGDIVLFLGITTILLKKPKEYSRKALYAIILGLISVAISDINFAYYTLQNISPTGTWAYVFFTITSYFMILAAFLQKRSALKHTSQNTVGIFQTKGFAWLPYAAIFVGYVMLLIVSQPYWSEPIGAFIFAAFIISALVVLRQMIATKDNLRLMAEKASAKSESKLRSLLENSSDITKILDNKGHFEYISPALEKDFGYTTKELIGSNLYSFVHPDDKGKLIKTYYENENNFEVKLELEYRFRHSDGTWRVLEGIGRNVLDEETNKCFTLVNSRDVTERKENEQKLREYTKKLQQSNRELQDFAFVASHDLQEPLRKVQAFGDRLASKYADILGENGLDYLARMQSASHRMQTLITDLLTFSRVTSQAKPFVEYDLNLIINDILSDLEVKIEETNAKIILEDLPKLEMDDTQMRQLFQNLIGNALKFSKSGTKPVIKIWGEINKNYDSSFKKVIFDELITTDAKIPAGYCRIHVEDNGIGFDEKYLDRIFTVFQRLHGRGEYEGSGVGLAVCRKIVERHNGNLSAKSQINNGTRFTITLPLTQTDPGELND